MSIYKGVFTETTLQNIRAKLEALMFDERVKLQFEPQIKAFEALNRFKNPNVNVVFDNKMKYYTLEAEWINACEIVDQACTNCSDGGKELSTNVKTYALDLCREVAFTISDYDMISNDFDSEDLIAKGFAKADAELSEWYTRQLIAFLNTNKGVNVLSPNTARGCISGFDTYIEAAYWTADLMGYMNRVSMQNRFKNPFLLTGANLHEQAIIAGYNSGNLDGKGDQAKFGAFPMFFDEFNIDAVNTPNLITYMIQPGSYAMGNKAYWGRTPTVYDFGQRWSMESKFMPGFEYDVQYSNTCDSDNNFPVHNFTVKFKAGNFINPEACDDNNTGILTFVCGDCPA